MSLILDALKKARLIAQGRDAAPEAQALMKNFGFSERARKQQLRRTILMYGLPALVIAAGIATAAGYWMKHQPKGSMTVARAVEPVETPTPAPVQPAAPPAAAALPSSPPPRPTFPAPAEPKPAAPPAVRPAPPKPPSEERPIIAVDRNVSTPEVAVPAAAVPPAARPPAIAVPETAARDPFDAMLGYLQVGNYAKALEECRKALLKPPQVAETHLNCGAAHIGLRNLDDAISELKQAIALNPSYSKAFFNLGTVYKMQGDNASADGAFERAIELNPNNAGAYVNRGTIAKAAGKLELAKNFFLEATRRDSRDILAHYDLAVVYDEQGETGKAIEYFRKFRDLAKGLPDWRAEVTHATSRIEELEKKLPKL